jgi:MFS family permease
MDYNNLYIRMLGASPTQLGSVNSVAGFASTLIAVPRGWLEDKYSLKKIFTISVAFFTFTPLIYALAQNWFWIIPAMILSVFSFPCGTICDVSLRSEDRGTGKALCETIGSAPSLIAPTLAALLITLLGGLSVEGVKPLYWIQFVGQGVLLLYVFTQMREIARSKIKIETSGFLSDFRVVFQQGDALKRWLMFSTAGIFTMMMASHFRAPFAYEIKNAEQFIIGGMATSSLAIQVLLATPIGRLADRIGRKKVFYLLMPLSCASNLVLIFSPSPEILIISGLLLGFEMIARIAVIGAMSAELVPVECIGRWRGILGLVGGLASVLAPITGGLVWENLGPSYVFLIPVAVDLLVRAPLLALIPETLILKSK